MHSIFNPAQARKQFLKREHSASGSEAGSYLLEILAGVALLAIIMLNVVPQIGKYMEKGAVNNLSSAVHQASLEIEAEIGVTGKNTYTTSELKTIVDAMPKSSGTVITATATGGTTSAASYKIVGTDPGVKNYCVSYESIGSTSGVKVASKGSPGC